MSSKNSLWQLESPQECWSISTLSSKIKIQVERIGLVWVIGEIASIKRHTSGHVYLSLKDKDNQIAAVMWRHKVISSAWLSKFVVGTEVMVCATVTTYGPQSKYQLRLEVMEKKGVGALQAAFEKLKAKLQNEGLFDRAVKKPLPSFPRKICIVTSPTGAAIQDILQVIHRRFPKLTIYIYPVAVQGEGASTQIAQALKQISHHSFFRELDLVVLTRGGGNYEDLWAFNEPEVAYAMYHCPIPIISAVGHEVDITIADYVADYRALTPTEAGEIAVAELNEIKQEMETLKKHLEKAIDHRFALAKSQLRELAHHRALARPQDKLAYLAQKIDGLQQRIASCVKKDLHQAHSDLAQLHSRLKPLSPQQRVAHYTQQLETLSERLHHLGKQVLVEKHQQLLAMNKQLTNLSPLGVLERGYSITFDQAGDKIIRHAQEVQPGECLWIRFSQSWVRVRVEQTSAGESS